MSSSPVPGTMAATSSTVIICLLEDYAHLQVLLQLWRALLHDLISLLVQRYQWIVGNQHLLKFCHEKGIEVWIPGVACGKSSLVIIDVELCIDRPLTFSG